MVGMKRTDLVKRIALTAAATGAVGAATVVPAAAAPVESATAAPAPASLLDVLPNPLNCLLSTGFAVFCLGVPLS